MKVMLFVRQWDAEAFGVVDAIDEYTIEENPDALKEMNEKHLVTDSDHERTRTIFIRIPDRLIEKLFEIQEIEAEIVNSN